MITDANHRKRKLPAVAFSRSWHGLLGYSKGGQCFGLFAHISNIGLFSRSITN